MPFALVLIFLPGKVCLAAHIDKSLTLTNLVTDVPTQTLKISPVLFNEQKLLSKNDLTMV